MALTGLDKFMENVSNKTLSLSRLEEAPKYSCLHLLLPEWPFIGYREKMLEQSNLQVSNGIRIILSASFIALLRGRRGRISASVKKCVAVGHTESRPRFKLQLN